MNFLDLSWIDLRAQANELLANFLWLPFVALPFFARFVFARITRTFRLGLISKLSLSAAIVFSAMGLALGQDSWLALVVGFLALTATGYFAARGFLKAGISDAFVATTAGIDYRGSLRMARQSIAFLGIGADKLTKLDEFKDAMHRCGANGNTARFLLSPPHNKQLETAAKRNDADPDLYKRNVTNSLRRLAELKRHTGLSIDVRFYPTEFKRDLQQFRLMFIDDEVCLLSWTVWGLHLGRNNPQVLLKNRKDAAELSLYKAFKDYYEEIWQDAEQIDLAEYE